MDGSHPGDHSRAHHRGLHHRAGQRLVGRAGHHAGPSLQAHHPGRCRASAPCASEGRRMTPPKTYQTPAGFKVALEDRLKKRASLRGTVVNRVRQRFVMERFLARIARTFGSSVTLKGGLALELRLANARSTKDVGLHTVGDPEAVLGRLREAAALDLGDHLAFTIDPDREHPAIEDTVYEGRRFRTVAKLAAASRITSTRREGAGAPGRGCRHGPRWGRRRVAKTNSNDADEPCTPNLPKPPPPRKRLVRPVRCLARRAPARCWTSRRHDVIARSPSNRRPTTSACLARLCWAGPPAPPRPSSPRPSVRSSRAPTACSSFGCCSPPPSS